MKNVILIGMPGVGKSTVGVILAKMLGYQFVDSDLLIQEQERKLLKDIIEKKGVEGFLAIENKVNSEIEVNHTVVATGGSAVYGEKAMTHFRSLGTVIYLKEEFSVLEKRLKDIKGRGVVVREGQTLQDLYEERTPLYEKYAHLVIETDGKGPEATIAKIMKKLS